MVRDMHVKKISYFYPFLFLFNIFYLLQMRLPKDKCTFLNSFQNAEHNVHCTRTYFCEPLSIHSSCSRDKFFQNGSPEVTLEGYQGGGTVGTGIQADCRLVRISAIRKNVTEIALSKQEFKKRYISVKFSKSLPNFYTVPKLILISA